MLARGLLCRLAAEVPKTSTHDLPQLARLLERSLSARNGASIRSMGTLSRGLRASVAISRRSYATTVRATKPTATVKTAVKKAAAKKPTTKKKAATATAAKTKKKPAVKKAAPKKKKAASKKAAPKRKRMKKVLTPEEKQKALIRQLKITALKEPFAHRALTTYSVFLSEILKGSKDTPAIVKESGGKFKALSTAEREHYNHLTTEKNAARRAEYDAWVRSYTPEQIKLANNARAYLRRLSTAITKSRTTKPGKIQDDRQPKRSISAYGFFSQERFSSGDMKGISVPESSKLIGQEWKALSASEKQKYHDIYDAAKVAKA